MKPERTARNISRSLLRAFILASAGVGLVLMGVPALHAEPYIAIREGYKCSKCHVNLTGGGKRTDFGNVYAQLRLPSTYSKWTTPEAQPPTPAQGGVELEEEELAGPAASTFFTGRLNDFISAGADLRAGFEYVSTPNEDVAHQFSVLKANVYLEADLIPGRALLYWGAPGGGEARETFALLQRLPGGMYLKAGQFFLPYGLRLQDDSAYIRAETGFTYNATDVGFEVGAEPGDWTLSLALTNGSGSGTDTDRQKKLTLSGAWVTSGGRAGLSYSNNEAEGGDTTAITGLFGGTSFGRFTLLFEADSISVTDSDGAENVKKTMFAEVNFLLSRGNNLKFSYDYLDPYDSVPEDVRDRFSVVYEPFIAQLTQLRFGVRLNDGPPQVDAWSADTAFAEMHFFF